MASERSDSAELPELEQMLNKITTNNTARNTKQTPLFRAEAQADKCEEADDEKSEHEQH